MFLDIATDACDLRYILIIITKCTYRISRLDILSETVVMPGKLQTRHHSYFSKVQIPGDQI